MHRKTSGEKLTNESDSKLRVRDNATYAIPGSNTPPRESSHRSKVNPRKKKMVLVIRKEKKKK